MEENFCILIKYSFSMSGKSHVYISEDLSDGLNCTAIMMGWMILSNHMGIFLWSNCVCLCMIWHTCIHVYRYAYIIAHINTNIKYICNYILNTF
jgi:hypothetical protein